MSGAHFTFFESMYRQAQKIRSDKERLAFYEAICSYAFDGVKVDLSDHPVADMGMEAVYPIIDKSMRRISAGREAVSKRWNKEEDTYIGTNETEIPKENTYIGTYATDRIGKDRNGMEGIGLDRTGEDILPPADAAPDVDEVISYLNTKAGTQYRLSSDATRKLIKARMKEGYKVEDFKTIVDNKVAQWGKDQKMRQFLRPETLFSKAHFESYLNELKPDPAAYQDEEFAAEFDRLVSS